MTKAQQTAPISCEPDGPMSVPEPVMSLANSDILASMPPAAPAAPAAPATISNPDRVAVLAQYGVSVEDLSPERLAAMEAMIAAAEDGNVTVQSSLDPSCGDGTTLPGTDPNTFSLTPNDVCGLQYTMGSGDDTLQLGTYGSNDGTGRGYSASIDGNVQASQQWMHRINALTRPAESLLQEPTEGVGMTDPLGDHLRKVAFERALSAPGPAPSPEEPSFLEQAAPYLSYLGRGLQIGAGIGEVIAGGASCLSGPLTGVGFLGCGLALNGLDTIRAGLMDDTTILDDVFQTGCDAAFGEGLGSTACQTIAGTAVGGGLAKGAQPLKMAGGTKSAMSAATGSGATGPGLLDRMRDPLRNPWNEWQQSMKGSNTLRRTEGATSETIGEAYKRARNDAWYPDASRNHTNYGDYKANRLKSGGHLDPAAHPGPSADSFVLDETVAYENGVRAGTVPNHRNGLKQTGHPNAAARGNTGQSVFPTGVGPDDTEAMAIEATRKHRATVRKQVRNGETPAPGKTTVPLKVDGPEGEMDVSAIMRDDYVQTVYPNADQPVPLRRGTRPPPSE